MQKVFKIEVDCPACAMKCQEAINKVEGVNNCQINFISQKMIIDADNKDDLIKKILKVAKKIEPDFEILG